MKTVAAVFVLVSLVIVVVEGRPNLGRQRCLCWDAGVNMLGPKMIEKVEILPQSPSCGRLEVIVTLKKGAGKKCLNPESWFTKRIMERIAQINKRV